MAFLHVNFYSQTLGINTAMNVILPEKKQGVGVVDKITKTPNVNPKKTKLDVWDGETPLPVLYLLHGATDDYTIWCRRTSIERYVAGKQIAVVMPSAGLSFYSNEINGYRYWDFISNELPTVVKSFFKISDKREDTFVAGISMGSYGAIKLALNYPEKYCKAGVLSGGMYLLNKDAGASEFVNRIYGSIENIKDTEDDLENVAKKLSESGKIKPELFFACGNKDFLYESHKKSVEYLTSLDFLIVNHEEEAYHEWAFWDKMIVKVLDWIGIK